MELLAYKDFEKLRIRSFFPADAQLTLDDSGSVECAIGPAFTEGLPFTYFAWPTRGSQRTGEISIDFRGECPLNIASKILAAINLPLNPEMSLSQLIQVLGEPEFKGEPFNSVTFYRFLCGEKWPYFIGCHVDGKLGLTGILIFRKDWARKS